MRSKYFWSDFIKSFMFGNNKPDTFKQNFKLYFLNYYFNTVEPFWVAPLNNGQLQITDVNLKICATFLWKKNPKDTLKSKIQTLLDNTFLV